MRFRARARGAIGPAQQPICRFELEQTIVLGFEALWEQPNLAIFERLFTADVVLVNHCPRHLSAIGGEHGGHSALAMAFQRFLADFSVGEPSVSTILADGLHFAVSYSLRLRHVGTGRSSRIAGMAHVTVEPDLRIKRIENFFDTAAMAEVGEMLEDFAARSEALDLARRSSRASFHNASPE